MKNYLNLLIGLLLTISSFAGETIYSERVERINIFNGDEINLTFEPLFDYGDYVDKHRAMLKLVYNRENQTDISWDTEWRYTIEFQFTEQIPLTTQTLEISYVNGEYVYSDYAYYNLLSATELSTSVDIISVSATYNSGSGWTSAVSPNSDPNLPRDIHLEFSVTTERYYVLDDTKEVRLTKDVSDDQIKLKWYFLEGAEEYDLEWVFIDSEFDGYDDLMSNVSSGSYDPEEPFLLKEPVGVRVNYNHYIIDKAFPTGSIFFRIRPVGRHTGIEVDGDYSHLKLGAWNYYNTAPTEGEPAAEPYLVYVTIDEADAFESDKNWAYSIGFSENGKFASGVNYMDGSFRSRQATAFNSTDEVSLKSESKYDYEGRMVVALPPAPVDGRNLAYEAGFNTVLSDPFNKQHFDEDTPEPLDNTSGISKYFSSNNDLEQENSDAIPDANGYVYSQVRYKKDGTGRAEKSGGVGEEFNITGDHTTDYYYGSPTYIEIKRLFGSNVGDNNNYYRRNMVKDPNGQYSVSYTDGHGRTIATALCGTSPDNLIDLDGTVETYTTPLNTG
ncbi:MAG: hypothetical protein MI810_10275, partial [Flavobacteriales bacterium]|nr:hypothetical protein [Flavobacteriales bacterium]